MKLTEATSKRIKQLLETGGLKPNYLHTEGGVPKSTVSTIINEKVKTVKLDTLYQICATLGVTLKEFFDDPIFDEVSD